MLHFFNCKKLKYIHDEPYTLTDSKNRKIKLKKGDALILDDGAMYRSLKYKTRLFVELELNNETKESKKGKESNETKEAEQEPTEEVSNKE